MRFEATEETLDGIETLCLRDAETGALSAILPQLGGTVRRLVLPTRSSSVSQAPGQALTRVLEEDTPQEVSRNPGFRGRILFPFNDRIPQGAYRFDRRDFRLRQNEPESESAIHGLIYDRRCKVSSVTADDRGARLTLSYHITPDEFPGYPFAVQLRAHYRLSEHGFELRLEALNTGSVAAPVSLGWHPYVATPNGVDAAFLRCPAGRFVEVDDQLLPTGALPPVAGGALDFRNAEPIGRRELDIALERRAGPNDPSAAVTTFVDRGCDVVALRQSNPPFRFTQLFIPRSRSSLAVEPVTAATNAFNRPELGLARLQSGERLIGTVSVWTLASSGRQPATGLRQDR